jgi:hypothetical protein
MPSRTAASLQEPTQQQELMRCLQEQQQQMDQASLTHIKRSQGSLVRH